MVTAERLESAAPKKGDMRRLDRGFLVPGPKAMSAAGQAAQPAEQVLEDLGWQVVVLEQNRACSTAPL